MNWTDIAVELMHRAVLAAREGDVVAAWKWARMHDQWLAEGVLVG